jgi:hypothetical protein
MRKSLLIAVALLTSAAAAPESGAAPKWPEDQVRLLRGWALAAPLDALQQPSTQALDNALAQGNGAEIDKAATDLALRLARMHLLGCAPEQERKSWHMPAIDDYYDLPSYLSFMLGKEDIDLFFSLLIPHHPDYGALRAAYAAETDPARRATLALNMERWRWLPVDLGENFLIVNAARFEVTYWKDGRKSGTWPVIVGKPKTPTPTFATFVKGVTFNPWWNVPKSIVAESVGSLVRRNPAEARRRGYVWGNGSYRQKPGPNNALGQMKLEMPNQFSIYLHDTPSKELFLKEVRAFSHGCIRVGDALGLANALLGSSLPKAKIDAIVAGRETQTHALPKAMPVYVTYFTADVGKDGRVATLPDLYHRDGGRAATPTRCAA